MSKNIILQHMYVVEKVVIHINFHPYMTPVFASNDYELVRLYLDENNLVENENCTITDVYCTIKNLDHLEND